MKAACRQQFAILGLYKKTLISQLVLKWTGINQVRHVWSAGKTFHYPCYGIMWMAAINWKCLLQEKETEFRHRLQFASLPVQKEMGVCPVCNGSFEVNVLEAHASGCGIDTITAGGSESLMDPQTDFESALNDRFDKMVLEGSWPINVVRRHFNNTAMEELSNGNIKDWGKKLNVKFIGEDGVDSGGLTREFFSLLFETSPVFEDNGFSYNADLLEKKHYQLMGKATSMAILHGHPGPRNLNRTIVDFILENKEPEEIPECCIQNAEVKAAIEEISTATKETIGDVFERHSHLLEASGYKQLLSVSNRDRAIRTMKFYYCFYKYIPPMLQFIEGLKLHDMLLLLTKHGENGRALLCCDTKSTSMSDVLAFFVPKFSKSEHEKADEEMIVYNFGKFLKKVENGAISTDWVKMNSSEESLKEVTINLGDVLQALIGCRQKEMGVCPVCNGSFEVNVLEAHASGCGIDTITAGGSESLMDPQTDFESALNDRFDKMVLEGSWPINVVRRHFNNTAMEELSNGNIKDWGKKLNVKFIGEDGVDSGGLTREFFSLLFETSPVFEDNGFSYNADLLEKKHYQLMGKATSMAILHGHPGPRNLNRTIVDFILENKEPEEIPECCIQNAEVKAAIEEISTATKETIGDVFERHSHLLEASGYKQLLSVSNRDRAIRTMKFYYCFYKYIPPMLQFIEGLKLHDMLLLLTKHGENGRALLCCDTKSTSMSDVLAFFVPKFSKSEHEKADEEMIVYNFGKFLKKVENGAISTDWVKMNSSEESLKEVTINLGDVLQALIGCRSLPRNIKSGEMEFDHLSNQLSYVNTCAPSIIFTRTKELVNYEKLEHHLICIIVEAEGFGLA
ncbi:uncharacterized protein LOC128209697 [Mya arenaria]|uniref:uncharacterized protein LOC128209697 n=1 Tax=Mya arenaria TaxID=6604 RepID=UPI0022E4A369|nr:uncharacterized protein LOC128209697 [Mya arenaria]